ARRPPARPAYRGHPPVPHVDGRNRRVPSVGWASRGTPCELIVKGVASDDGTASGNWYWVSTFDLKFAKERSTAEVNAASFSVIQSGRYSVMKTPNRVKKTRRASNVPMTATTPRSPRNRRRARR